MDAKDGEHSEEGRELEKPSRVSDAPPQPPDLSIHAFYHTTLQLLSRTVRALRSSPSQVDLDSSLCESCLNLLYLWAHGIDLRYLENTVSKDTGLQEIIAELLADVASILVSDVFAHCGVDLQDDVANHIPAFLARHIKTDDWSDASSVITITSVDDDATIAVAAEKSTTEPNSDELSDRQHVVPTHDYTHAFKKIHGHIEALMNLLPTIDSCCNEEIVDLLPDDVTRKPQEMYISDNAQPFINQICDKFPAIDRSIAQRLGQANWERFARLQTIKEEPVIDKPVGIQLEIEIEDQATTIKPPTQSVFQPYTEFQDSGLGASLPTRSIYAMSNASHRSLLSTQSAIDREAFRVPDTPAEVFAGTAFSCEICGQLLVNIKNRVDWKLHVFADLQPYICTFDRCSKDNLTFSNRKQWSDHEFSEHRRHIVWRCSDCRKDFLDEDLLFSHRQEFHADKHVRNTNYRNSLMNTCKYSLQNRIETEECPCCLAKDFRSQRDFVSHVCRHMEEVALAVLPCNVDNDEAQIDSDETDSLYEPERFACPFSKHDPKRFSSRNKAELNYQACENACISDMQQLYGHLTGVHSEPEHYCNRCYEEFRHSEQLTEHKKAKFRCLKRASPFPERLNRTKQAEIFLKLSGMPPETVWNNIYRTLFPGSPLPNSPYFGFPEKCPVVACYYHTKGFARKHDKTRHVLTHYKGSMSCGFCPMDESSERVFFNRADVLKRHLVRVHGIQARYSSTSRSSVLSQDQSSLHPASIGKCSICSGIFNNAQDFYNHLDECVLRVIEQVNDSERINEMRLAEVRDDPVVHETLVRNGVGIIQADASRRYEEVSDAPGGIEDANESSGSDVVALDVLMDRATRFYEERRFNEAEKLDVQILDMQRKLLGEQHLETIDCMTKLASTYYQLGRWQESERLDLRALDVRKTVLGEEHPDTLTVMSSLASVYWKQGRFEEAEKLDVQVFRIREKTLGAEDLRTLRSMSHLAATYLKLGRLDEAETWITKAVETQKRKLGEEQADTLTSMAHLASIQREQGRLDEAERLGMRLLNLRKKVIGREHPETLRSMYNLALTYRKQGRFDEAETFGGLTFQMRKRLLGDSHPDTRESASELALVKAEKDKTSGLEWRCTIEAGADDLSCDDFRFRTFDEMLHHLHTHERKISGNRTLDEHISYLKYAETVPEHEGYDKVAAHLLFSTIFPGRDVPYLYFIRLPDGSRQPLPLSTLTGNAPWPDRHVIASEKASATPAESPGERISRRQVHLPQSRTRKASAAVTGLESDSDGEESLHEFQESDDRHRQSPVDSDEEQIFNEYHDDPEQSDGDTEEKVYRSWDNYRRHSEDEVDHQDQNEQRPGMSAPVQQQLQQWTHKLWHNAMAQAAQKYGGNTSMVPFLEQHALQHQAQQRAREMMQQRQQQTMQSMNAGDMYREIHDPHHSEHDTDSPEESDADDVANDGEEERVSSKHSAIKKEAELARSVLKCFDAELYATLQELENLPDRCIAPTYRTTRCAWLLTPQDVSEAEFMKRQACNLAPGSERDKLIKQFILLHCCTEQHRWRLQHSGNDCLQQLVRSYGAVIVAAEPKSSTRPITEMKCICVGNLGYGSTASCPKCDTLQHVKCYYRDTKVPEDHLCLDCLAADPGNTDKAALQMQILRNQVQIYQDQLKSSGHLPHKEVKQESPATLEGRKDKPRHTVSAPTSASFVQSAATRLSPKRRRRDIFDTMEFAGKWSA